MDQLRNQLSGRAALLRILPFAVFLGLTFLQGKLGPESHFWVYLAKTIVGAWLLWVVWPLIAEMRWKFSWESVVAGVLVFVIWVGLDGLYPSVNELLQRAGLSKAEATSTDTAWNPHAHFGAGTAMAWFFIVVRIAGSSIVVPPLEEVFYRSFLYRWIIRPDFASVPLGQFNWRAFLITALIFGFAHSEWLAGILCALAYQGLVIRKKRLGDAMTAHAITNLLLGIWIVWQGAWRFW